MLRLLLALLSVAAAAGQAEQEVQAAVTERGKRMRGRGCIDHQSLLPTV